MDDWLEGISRNLASNLASLRAKRGLSQSALAKLARVPRSTVAHLETGGGNPSLANLARLSAALHVGLEELLGRPRPRCQLTKAAEVRTVRRSQGVATVFKLLPEARTALGMDHTVSFQLLPEQSTAAIITHHPAAKYYAVSGQGLGDRSQETGVRTPEPQST